MAWWLKSIIIIGFYILVQVGTAIMKKLTGDKIIYPCYTNIIAALLVMLILSLR